MVVEFDSMPMVHCIRSWSLSGGGELRKAAVLI